MVDSFQLLQSEPTPITGRQEPEHTEGINCSPLGISPLPFFFYSHVEKAREGT